MFVLAGRVLRALVSSAASCKRAPRLRFCRHCLLTTNVLGHTFGMSGCGAARRRQLCSLRCSRGCTSGMAGSLGRITCRARASASSTACCPSKPIPTATSIESVLHGSLMMMANAHAPASCSFLMAGDYHTGMCPTRLISSCCSRTRRLRRLPSAISALSLSSAADALHSAEWLCGGMWPCFGTMLLLVVSCTLPVVCCAMRVQAASVP